VGELVASLPNPDLLDWASQRFDELHASYSDDDFVPGEIDEPVEENADGTVIVKFRLRLMPREDKRSGKSADG